MQKMLGEWVIHPSVIQDFLDALSDSLSIQIPRRHPPTPYLCRNICSPERNSIWGMILLETLYIYGTKYNSFRIDKNAFSTNDVLFPVVRGKPFDRKRVFQQEKGIPGRIQMDPYSYIYGPPEPGYFHFLKGIAFAGWATGRPGFELFWALRIWEFFFPVERVSPGNRKKVLHTHSRRPCRPAGHNCD